jgi:hypothetical protein
VVTMRDGLIARMEGFWDRGPPRRGTRARTGTRFWYPFPQPIGRVRQNPARRAGFRRAADLSEIRAMWLGHAGGPILATTSATASLLSLMYGRWWRLRTKGRADVLLAARASSDANEAALLPVGQGDSRTERAHLYRTDLRSYASQGGAGVLNIGRGVAGRWELLIELERSCRSCGAGRALMAAAPHPDPER